MSSRELACVSWSANPIEPYAQSRAVAPGCTIGSLLPEGWETRRVICKYNGRWILRAGWACPVQAGDTVEFHELLEGRNGLRTVLSILVVVVAVITQQYYAAQYGLAYGAAAGAAVSIAGNLAINALVPLQADLTAANTGQSFASVYNVGISGNQARIDQAIPVIYGRHLVKPDYATEPYFTFDGNGDQIGHFLYCIGHGRFQIEQELIGRSKLGGFQDVLVRKLLEPGEVPLNVLDVVVTSREVISLDLPAGRRVGGFVACAPNKRVRAIELDFVCPRGQSIVISVQITIRTIDDLGNGLTPWSILASENFSGTTAKPTRLTRRYTLATPARVEVRVVRTSVHDDDPSVPNEIEWAALKGYLDGFAPLCSTASHFELVMRSSEQLSSVSQNQFGLVLQRLLRVWSPGTGWTADGDEVPTRNPFHAVADALTNTAYATHPLPDARVDLATIHALSLTAAARQDRCDMVFDGFVSGWEAVKQIARTGRATPFRRNGVCTVARDEPQELTVTAFDSRSILPGSFGVAQALPSRETADGVIAEYFDYRAWDWVEVECPAPGYTVTDPDDPRFDPDLPPMAIPERKRYKGITGPKHAEREGLYDAAWPIYRRRVSSWSTELQGMLPAFGCEVMLAPVFYRQAGDVAFWDAGTRVMGLTEPPMFEPGVAHVITFTRDDGSLHPPIAVTPGPTEFDVVLASVPDFPLVLNDGTRERPRYQFGSDDTSKLMVRVTNIQHQGVSDEGVHSYTLTGIADDERVHLRDIHLLPAPGETQDVLVPGDPVPEGSEGGSDVYIVDQPDFGGSTTVGGSGATVNYTLRNTGVTETDSGFPIGGWLRFGAVDPSIAARYSVRFTAAPVLWPDGTTSVYNPSFGGVIGADGVTWHNLGTDRTVTATVVPGPPTVDYYSSIYVEIRNEVDVIQDTATFSFRIFKFAL